MSSYQIVTDKIIEAIERGGVAPWKKPWVSGARNLISGKDYRGINALLLSSAPFSSSYWVTFNQARSKGGFVRKGEKGYPIVFWQVTDNQEETEEEKSFILRYSTVFNLEQCEGIEAPESSLKELSSEERNDRCEQIIENFISKPTIQELEPQAYYRVSNDLVNMPARKTFNSADGYYATLFHELIHSTGHLSRLNRPGLMKHSFFGSADYSKEELVAEIGAAFLCAEASISPAVIENSVSYLNGWLKALRADGKMLIQAAAQAQKAVDHILGRESEIKSEDHG